MPNNKVICENCIKWTRINKFRGYCESKKDTTDARKRRLCGKFLDPIDQKLKEANI